MSQPTDSQSASNESTQSKKLLGRKSRSISRYFLGPKRSSIDGINEETFIRHSLTSAGILDSFNLWSFVTLFHDFTTCRRLLILTDKNQLIIGKCFQRQSLVKIKQRIDIDHIWLQTELQHSITSEISSLNYYDSNRSLVIGWPLTENYIAEFSNKSTRDIWKERFQSNLQRWWQTRTNNVEHVRIVIDQDAQNSFLIRKLIGIRPEETVRDLIRKCIDAFHLRDPIVDNYLLFVSNPTSIISHTTTNSSASIQRLNRPLIGHEYPYSIKMKHIKAVNGISSNNRSFDTDEHSNYPLTQSSASLTSINASSTTYHDFELRKREMNSDQPMKKHRFFHKRQTKLLQQFSDDYHSSSTAYLSSPNRPKNFSSRFFGHKLDELMHRYDHQLPPVIMQLLEILYVKGPEATGIFRKVANARSVKDAIEKIERNLPLSETDLHPILAAGIFKHFLRTLPEPVFNSIQYDCWKKCLRLSTLTEKISYAKINILYNSSQANHILLKGLICILYRIAQNADANGMNPFNLGLCVSNSLFKTESTTITSGKQEADVMSSIVEFLIENSIALFGADVLTCVSDKCILVQKPSHPITASSIESLDEVESSPQLPIINRSHDSGLAVSDQPFHDDSSEISENIQRRTLPDAPLLSEWASSIACGKGLVLTSIVLPSNSVTTSHLSKTAMITRRRSSKTSYKPSKQFLEREKFTNDTTDDSDHPSSLRSSSTTVQTLSSTKVKRSKSLSRHSSLGSGEQQKPFIKETRRSAMNYDVKRTTSLKQIHRSSDEADDDDDHEKKSFLTPNDPPQTNPTQIDSIRSAFSDQQDLDLVNEIIPSIHQASSGRSVSFSTVTNKPIHPDSLSKPTFTRKSVEHHSRLHGPLSSTTNQIIRTQPNVTHNNQSNLSNRKPTERVRTFVHQSNSRPFVLGKPIQMKPIGETTLFQGRNRHEIAGTNAVRVSDEHRLGSVREKAKLFEHISTQKLSTGRENYV